MANQTLNIKEGCYLIRFTPDEPLSGVKHYDGTMRVEHDENNIIASGDLYVHKTDSDREEPDPSKGIPIFPIPDYRYWLHVTQIVPRLEEANSFTAVFEPHRFNKEDKRFINMGTFVAAMTKTNAPPDYPSGSQYFTGDVTEKTTNARVGSLTMGWVSENLRRAVLEIDRAKPAMGKQPEFPLRGGNPKDGKLDDSSLTAWQEALKNVKWKIAAPPINGGSASDSDIAEPDSSDGGFWTEGELHEQMLHSRVSSTMLDEEWHYYLLCVRRITTQERGVLFDVGGTDSNNMPREGAAIASAWPFPPKEPKHPVWGEIDDELKGKPFGDQKEPYFRAAVHEIGHAMGLDHNVADNGFMNTTDAIAEDTASGKFPANIKYDFAPDDQQHLRHGPDISVRPGGVAWIGGNAVFPDTKTLGDAAAALDSKEFDLQVSAPLVDSKREKTLEPLIEGVPLGAPVRIKFTLKNITKNPLKVPANLSLKSGNTTGKVVNPNGKVRAFLPLMKCMDEGALRELSPGESVSEWMTLLRGPDGALFPEAGFYRVTVEISWNSPSLIHQRKLLQDLLAARVGEAEAKEFVENYYKKHDADRYEFIKQLQGLIQRKFLQDLQAAGVVDAEARKFVGEYYKNPARDRREFVKKLQDWNVKPPSSAVELAAKYAGDSHDFLKAYLVKGETNVRVRKPLNDDPNHAKIAEKILNTKDTLLSLAIGGDHLVEGKEVIAAAVNNPAYQVLRPHWAIVEAKRWAQRHFGRAADIVAACKLLDEDSVLSVPECKRMLELIARAIPGKPDRAKDPDVQRVVLVLMDKIQSLGVDADTGKFISQLPHETFLSVSECNLMLELIKGAIQREPKREPDHAKNSVAQKVVAGIFDRIRVLGVDAETLKLIHQFPDLMFSSEETARQLGALTRSVKEKEKLPEHGLFLERLVKSDLVQKTSEAATNIHKESRDDWQKR